MIPSRSELPEPIARRRVYRRLMVACVVAGVIGFVVGVNLGYPVVGVGIYWLGVLAFVGVGYATDCLAFDERDVAIERRASQIAILVAAVALIVFGPALTVLDEAGVGVPTVVEGALQGYVVLFVVFAVAYGWLRFRP